VKRKSFEAHLKPSQVTALVTSGKVNWHKCTSVAFTKLTVALPEDFIKTSEEREEKLQLSPSSSLKNCLP